ncbi:MAG: dihydroorotase [Bacteroidetes bacterium]|nr:dihydroorotase [Bacteroidota bacterium]
MKTLLKGGTIVNEGKKIVADLLINGERIERIDSNIEVLEACNEINCEGLLILPGCIDDQVHFREPGLTHKGRIYSESRAAVAGGITSFMEMPNTVPNALTQNLLADKYELGRKNSWANYSFFMGASNDNLEEVLKTNGNDVCGIKIFMGSSTGNMLVDNTAVLEKLFANVPLLIATHCEDEATIRANIEIYKNKYGENVPIECHPEIRSEEACYLSSSKAVELARRNGTRLHILHISTAKELELFDTNIALENKKITAEACIHHLWFSDQDYKEKGSLIKWNPAVKTAEDREGIWKGVLNNAIDVIATDHAPHTFEEKQGSYFNAPSGGPLVQHALLAMLESVEKGRISIERMVEKMAHAPAVLFRVIDRGFLREGYKADIVIVDPNKKTKVGPENVLYQCGWSPFDGYTFNNQIDSTFVNGQLVFDKGELHELNAGQRLNFKL